MAYTYTNEWETTKPENSTLAGYMAQHMRNLKVDVQERLRFPEWSQGEKLYAQGNVSGAVTIDIENGNVFEMTLTGDVTSLTVDNISDYDETLIQITLIIHNGDTGGYEFAFPSGAVWPFGNDVVICDDADTYSIVNMVSIDGGTSYSMAIYGTGFPEPT
jgi:hypothetical protein